jgi:hypothetical protein
MPGAHEGGTFRLPAFLYFSYETQRRAIWLSYGSAAHHTCWIRKEAVMAATTFNAPHWKGHVREQLGSVLHAFREMLDAFVSNRIRRAAAEAEHLNPRPSQDTQTQSINTQ